MTKTKKQLRAEAVERLKEYHDWEAHLKSLANITLTIWPMSVDMSNDKRVDALIDLLTDDANDDSTPEKVVSGSEPCVTPESCRQYADQRKRSDTPGYESDSREKLEADVRKHYAYSTTTLMYPPSANKTTDMLGALPVDTVIGWLDRQAAITERECRKPNWSYCETCEALEKLTAERDTLQGALDIAVQNESKLEAERELYREALSQLLDTVTDGMGKVSAILDNYDEGMA